MEQLTREMEDMEPTGVMFDLIMGVDPATLTPDQLVTLCVVTRKFMGFCEWLLLSALRHADDTTEVAMAVSTAAGSARCGSGPATSPTPP